MTLSIVLSGPRTQLAPMRGALEGAGFKVGPEEHGHGLPSHRDGPSAKEAGHVSGYDELAEPDEDGLTVVGRSVGHQFYADDPDIAWITAEGDDIDRAEDVASRFGWLLRMHGERSSKLVRPGDLTFEELKG